MGWSEGRSQSGLRPAAYACNDWSMLNAMRAYDAYKGPPDMRKLVGN